MNTRYDPYQSAPGLYEAMRGIYLQGRKSALDPKLLHLVELRASQINGCAFCLDMHARDAKAAGETDARLYLLSAWREAPVYTPNERAALAWTEAVTLIAERGVPDDVFNETRQQFSEAELANLTAAVVAINGWNRLGVAFRREPTLGKVQT